MVNPGEVEVMSGEPPIGEEYLELGYITVDEGMVSPAMTMFTSDKAIIEMVRKEAADHGADAVIEFNLKENIRIVKPKELLLFIRK